MNKLIDIAIDRSRTGFMVLILLLISGIATYFTIPKESSPDIPIPVIYVSMTYDGISPEDATKLLVKPMEKELRDVEGLDEMEATAYEGGANVVMHFRAGFDSQKALDDVREKVDLAKAELPKAEEAEEPRVTEINFSLFPILTIVLEGDAPERTLKKIAEDLQDDLEGLKGVLEVEILGLREEQLLIEVDDIKLQSYGINPERIMQVINNNNLLVAAGSLELASGRYAVKVPGLFKSAQELLDLPVVTVNDQLVRVRDVATVRLGFKDATSISRVNGSPALLLQVKKRSGENVIETVDAVKAKVSEAKKAWPENIAYKFTSDESRTIRTMLSDLQNNVLTAVLLVMIVILAALGPRPALLVATAIPGSFLTAILLIGAMGISMNIVVLFSLILAVGMLVDGAIVVTELADYYRANGQSKRDAFANAAKYMAWPIIASTATTLAAFFPLLFWPGISGEFMKFMPITLIFTLSASLIMALIFLPMLGVNLPGGNMPPPVSEEGDGPWAQRYEKLLSWSIDHPWRVVLMVTSVFMGVLALYSGIGPFLNFLLGMVSGFASMAVAFLLIWSAWQGVRTLMRWKFWNNISKSTSRTLAHWRTHWRKGVLLFVAALAIQFVIPPAVKFITHWNGNLVKVACSAKSAPVARVLAGPYCPLGRGIEFFPEIEPERANLVVHAKGDFSIYAQDAMMKQVEERLIGLPGVAVLNVASGAAPGESSGPSDVVGTLFLEYEPWEIRGPKGWTSAKILSEAHKRTQDLYGLTIETQEEQGGPGDGKPIKLVLTAPVYDILPPIVAEIEDLLGQIPGTMNIDSNLPEPGIEWQLDVDRAKAARANTNLAEVGGLIRLATGGAIVGQYRPANSKDEIDIVARFKNSERNLTTIDDLTINAGNGQVPLTDFVERKAQQKVTVINRLDQRNAVYIESDVKPGYLANDIVQIIKSRMDEFPLPDGVTLEFKGEDEDQREASQFLMRAFTISLFIMAIILVTQFNSYYQALIILSAVILSTSGALLGHILIGKAFSVIMSGVGIIALAGVVVNNNIVLIDTFNKFRDRMAWRDALIATGKQRLRPVFLTAVTTVTGLLGMGFKVNIALIERSITYNAPSSQWWDQLASSIIFGLTFATVLTLIVTPCLIALGCLKGEKVAKK
jgi:multidrug efflux pump